VSEPAEEIETKKSRFGRTAVVLLAVPALFVVGLAAGIGAGLGTTRESTTPAAEHSRHEEPVVAAIDRHLRNHEYDRALAACESEAADPEDPRLRYRWAICHERLGATAVACGAYERLASRCGGELGIHATLGFVRCGLAEGRIEAAAGALARLNELDPFFDSRIGEERTRLKACLLFRQLGPVTAPDPFDATAIAWPSTVEGRTDRPLWLPAMHGAADPTILVPLDSHFPIASWPSGEPAREAVRDALTAITESGAHPTASLALANLDRLDGRAAAADARYKRILLDDPDSPEALRASYNLGLAALANGSIAAAREAFLGVVDRDPNGPWGILGRYWIGRTHLDGGDWTAARKAFLAAVGGSTRRVRAAAGFGWALSRLLDGNEDAFDYLVDHLEPDSDPTSLALRDGFDAIRRWRARPTGLRSEEVGRALESVGEFRSFGPAGVLAAGRLWIGIGRAERAGKLYDSVASDHRGPLAMRLVHESAGVWSMLGRVKEARSRYGTVAALDERDLGLDAELKLAAMDLDDDRADEALRRAYRVWRARGDASKEMLGIMARGYERLGRYTAAAECYSGRVPGLD
jgi:tetratricopeptide (TPR) repeat protein